MGKRINLAVDFACRMKVRHEIVGKVEWESDLQLEDGERERETAGS